jgi:hypothetical protein
MSDLFNEYLGDNRTRYQAPEYASWAPRQIEIHRSAILKLASAGSTLQKNITYLERSPFVDNNKGDNVAARLEALMLQVKNVIDGIRDIDEEIEGKKQSELDDGLLL